jgi:hypothetical protein
VYKKKYINKTGCLNIKLLVYVQDVPGSLPGRDANYSEKKDFYVFPNSLPSIY